MLTVARLLPGCCRNVVYFLINQGLSNFVLGLSRQEQTPSQVKFLSPLEDVKRYFTNIYKFLTVNSFLNSRLFNRCPVVARFETGTKSPSQFCGGFFLWRNHET